MGCTPSKANITYTHERVCGDLDTCSTFLPSVKSSVSTPERPSTRPHGHTGANCRETFLTGKIGDVIVSDCLQYRTYDVTRLLLSICFLCELQ